MILVTGGSGFLGKAIADTIGDDAITLSLSKDSSRPHENQIAFDLTQIDKVDELVETIKPHKVTHIIHAAAVTPWSGGVDYELDIQMAKTLVSLSQQAGIEQVIFLSGWNVYDMVTTQPPYSEATPTGPTEAYGKSKLRVEQYLSQNLGETKLTILRLSSVYGPGQISKGLIPNLVRSALSNQKIALNSEKTRRDYLYIDDLLVTMKALLQENNPPEIMNVGSGTTVSVSDVAESIKEICRDDYSLTIEIELPESPIESEVTNNQLSITKAQSLGLIKETTNFNYGLKEYIKWIKHENIL